MAKRRITKRANGSGSIIKLSGSRRKPFAVRVTSGKDDFNNPIRKNLDYFETREEAQDFLDMYNLMKRRDDRKKISDEQAQLISPGLYNHVKEVQGIEKTMLTFKDIFNILYEEKYIYQASCKSKMSWFKNMNQLHDKTINNISLFDIQNIFDKLKETKGTGTLSHMKIIVKDIFEYAVIHQYIDRNKDFSNYIDVSPKPLVQTPTFKHVPFSHEEIIKIIENGSEEAKVCLIYIFTGARPTELFEIDINKIFIDVECSDDGNISTVSYMIAGSKTEAGKNRIIPIHDFIKPFIIELLKKHNDYLILGDIKNKLHHYKYHYFDKLMQDLEMNHTPYDCRHTFSTLAKLNNVDDFSRKRILGHKAQDLTDDVYTHTIKNKLYSEINKIKVPK